MRKFLAFSLLILSFFPAAASAWWNADWGHRRQIVLDASPSGAALAGPAGAVVLPLRLHTGNFPFGEAKEDGADLRIVSGDDKTPLQFHVESFDSINELAIVWVQVPALAPGQTRLWLYWGNPKAAPAGEPAGAYDSSHLAVLHFGEREGAPRDATALGHHATAAKGTTSVSGGPLGAAIALDGSGAVTLGPAPGLRFGAGGFTFSGWLRPAAPQNSTLFSAGDAKAGLSLLIEGTTVVARLASGGSVVQTRGGELPAGRWTHVVVSVAERLVIYVDGREVASAAAKAPEVGGEFLIGAGTGGAAGFSGEMDALQLAAVARSADWVRAAWAGQSPDGKLVAWGDQEVTGGTSYLGVLVGALTVDAWVVIGILAVMFLVSFAIMVEKGFFVARAARANAGFRDAFAGLQDDLAALHAPAGGSAVAHDDAPLYRLYAAGLRELDARIAASRARGAALRLTPQALDAIRASLDASLTRESFRLNNRMVLLTIAISGGPFLGLLGTVVGVMIVFAAVAAAGDVNVNAIAPGIAAALLATVAGLGVAIPALFGYNYLASRIKDVTADMRVFNDELLAKLAERHAD